MKFRDKEVLEAFGKHIKLLRASKGITQEELAYSSNISLSQIARIETGVVNPTLCTMVVITKTLNCSLAELVDFQIK